MTDAIKDHLSEALTKGYVAAFRLLGNPDESREACQEAAAKAWAAKASYDDSKPFYPWFYRILKNHCLDRLRQRKRVQPLAEMEVASTRASAESSFLAQEREATVLRAIEALSDDHRELIELRHFQDLSYEEIAQVLDCPQGTVMSRLYRARKALRAELLKDPEFRFEHPQNEATS